MIFAATARRYQGLRDGPASFRHFIQAIDDDCVQQAAVVFGIVMIVCL